jgi:hypothetical protein
MAQQTSHELTAGQYAKWKSLSKHANEKACKPWAQRVTDTHEKYGVDGEWLEKNYIDDHPHFDVSGLTTGDLLKVSGASHNNRKHAYYRVVSRDDEELVVDELSESDVMEALNDTDEADGLREDVRSHLDDLDAEELEHILGYIERRTDGDD